VRTDLRVRLSIITTPRYLEWYGPSHRKIKACELLALDIAAENRGNKELSEGMTEYFGSETEEDPLSNLV